MEDISSVVIFFFTFVNVERFTVVVNGILYCVYKECVLHCTMQHLNNIIRVLYCTVQPWII